MPLAQLLIAKPKWTRSIKLSLENTLCVCAGFVPYLLVHMTQQEAMANKKIEYILIDSRGGMVNMIWPVEVVLRRYPNATIIILEAYSSAAFLATRLPNKKVIVAGGSLLYHKAFLQGKPSQEEFTRLQIDNYLLMIDLANLLKIPYKVYKDKVEAGDWVIKDEEALSLGIVSEIVTLTW